MWRARIAQMGPVTFGAPARPDDLAAAEAALGAPLPATLVELLRESDGVEGEYGVELVWPLDRIVEDNRQFRTDRDFGDLYMPFDPLLFFGDAGNGDQFAFVRTPPRDDVFVWDHETDSRTWVAPSLDTYLQWFLDGTLEV